MINKMSTFSSIVRSSRLRVKSSSVRVCRVSSSSDSDDSLLSEILESVTFKVVFISLFSIWELLVELSSRLIRDFPNFS